MTDVRGLLVLAVVLGACGGAGSGAYGGAAKASATPAYVPPAYATNPTSATTEPPKGYGYGSRPSGAPAATGELKIVDNPKLGKILAGSNGMTLYTFKPDSANTSTCYNACAKTWPPYTILGDPVAPPGLSGKLGTAARTDGSRQVTYNSLPLYTYGGDQAAGNANGEGLGGNWFSIKNP